MPRRKKKPQVEPPKREASPDVEYVIVDEEPKSFKIAPSRFLYKQIIYINKEWTTKQQAT